MLSAYSVYTLSPVISLLYLYFSMNSAYSTLSSVYSILSSAVL